MGGGMGCGKMGAMNLTPEQAGKFFDLKEKFRNDNAEARKQMMVKHAELAALWKSATPDEKAIVAKQKELNALRDQMQEKSIAFRLEARKIAPELAQGFGRGMGGGMGHGGKGCGMMGAMNLTPDQAGKFFDLKGKFRNDTAAARKDMMVKHAELAALKKAEKPDQAAIDAKQKELKALWDQMKEKRTAFQAEAGKISPELAQDFGRGKGGGMGGHGGKGPGVCPVGEACVAPGPGAPAK
jgi:zinc resistance-associated protein